MIKIEALKVEKTFYKREKDVFGNVTRTPYTKMMSRGVNVVSSGVRFGYYFIDIIAIQLIQFVFGLILGAIIASTRMDELAIGIIANIVSIAVFFLYYSIFEAFLGGTLGKQICGYTVIDEYAERVTFPSAMLRTVCRMVPFEAFSCFGERGWHDKWSKTYVVKRTEQDELWKLLGKMNRNETILD